jgi:NADPH-dependent curcumin reductase CurA
MAKTISREIHLKRRPVGVPGESDFALAQVPVPEPGKGEVRAVAVDGTLQFVSQPHIMTYGAVWTILPC